MNTFCNGKLYFSSSITSACRKTCVKPWTDTGSVVSWGSWSKMCDYCSRCFKNCCLIFLTTKSYLLQKYRISDAGADPGEKEGRERNSVVSPPDLQHSTQKQHRSPSHQRYLLCEIWAWFLPIFKNFSAGNHRGGDDCNGVISGQTSPRRGILNMPFVSDISNNFYHALKDTFFTKKRVFCRVFSFCTSPPRRETRRVVLGR